MAVPAWGNFDYPKACGCSGPCSHGVAGSQGTTVANPVYVGDKVGEILIRHGGIETNYIYREPFALGMAGLLFDIKPHTYADGTTVFTYKLKANLGSKSRMKQVAISKRDGCCAVIWYEGTAANTTTTLAVAATAGDTEIELVDGASIGGIATPMTLILKDEVNGKRVTVTVVAADAGNPNLLTLKNPLPVDIDLSACVYRGHYNPAAGCTNTYSNNVSFYNEDKEYHSYFTRIIHTLDYTDRCMLNQTYLADLLSGDGAKQQTAAYRILQSNFSQQIDEAMKQFIRSVFFHRNFCGDADCGGETYGLLEKMREIHESGVPQFFNLRDCCDTDECDAVNAETLINTFLKVVMSRAQLSVYQENRRVVVAMNSAFQEQLMNMRKYMEMYTGEVRTIEQGTANNGDIISTRRKTFRIEDRGYEIMFVLEPALDEIPWEFGLIMPENTMGVFTYKKDYVDVNGSGVTIVDDKTQLVSGDSLKFKLWKDERTNNMVDGCTSYVMWLEYAIVWLYVDKCAYAGITGFGLCNEEVDCHDCSGVNTDVPFCAA